MKFGHFDDKNREYVITNPQTPWPWINYLGNEDFFSLISNTAGGYSFYKDAKFRRLTRYRYNNVPMDSGGRYFYIKDDETIWSPGWKPCERESRIVLYNFTLLARSSLSLATFSICLILYDNTPVIIAMIKYITNSMVSSVLET